MASDMTNKLNAEADRQARAVHELGTVLDVPNAAAKAAGATKTIAGAGATGERNPALAASITMKESMAKDNGTEDKTVGHF